MTDRVNWDGGEWVGWQVCKVGKVCPLMWLLLSVTKTRETLNHARARAYLSFSFAFQHVIRLIFLLPMLFERRFNVQCI